MTYALQLYFYSFYCLLLILSFVDGFSLNAALFPSLTNRHGSTVQSVRNLVLYAKPPPTEGIDLEAIEAFESQLEALEQENSVDDDDGDFDAAVSAAGDVRTVTVPPELHNKRIDAAIAELLEPKTSRSLCGNLVLDGRVSRVSSSNEAEDKDEDLLEEIIDRKSFKVESGMVLKIALPVDEQPTEIVAQDIPLDILYEDEHMIVLNKAANMVVHPAAGNWDGTVVNALAYYLPRSAHGRGDFLDADGKPTVSKSDTNQKVVLDDGQSIDETNTVTFRPGIVHRLDKGTTGCLVVAKTSQALTALSQDFAARNVKKTYLAITVGNPGRNVKIDKAIGRHPVHRQRMRVVPDPHQKNSRFRKITPTDRMIKEKPPSQTGRRALSFVDTLAFDGKLSLARVKIQTGRTHQIRVHLQDHHTPIYGDDIYGLADWNKRLIKSHQIERPLLHAYKLSLRHPVTGESLSFTAPLDPDMERIATTIVPPGGEQELSELINWD